ncbi:MAG TPA: hypothetical protein VNW71_02825, partial [Thermoanaerobaculia bacterium]|nr:hypothetical protein [Thermoanaerobaculia bacterium]
LQELPDQLVDVHHSPDLYLSGRVTERAQGIYSFFGQAAPPQAAPARSPSFQPAPRPSYPSPYTPRPTGRVVVPEPDESAVPRRPIKRGSRVRHPTLGSGVVLEMEGQGEEMRITVFFEKAGKRKLVAKFANLEML